MMPTLSKKLIKMDYMSIWLSSSRLKRIILDILEWTVIIGVGFLFPYPKLPFPLISRMAGVILIVAGFFIRRAAGSANKQFLQPKEKIERLAATEIYSKIRHPCYTGFIFYYFGCLFIFGFLSMLIPIFVFSCIFYDSAVREENFLINRFGKDYEEYMKKVPYRFIPKVF